jgi:hypothetical protein
VSGKARKVLKNVSLACITHGGYREVERERKKEGTRGRKKEEGGEREREKKLIPQLH